MAEMTVQETINEQLKRGAEVQNPGTNYIEEFSNYDVEAGVAQAKGLQTSVTVGDHVPQADASKEDRHITNGQGFGQAGKENADYPTRMVAVADNFKTSKGITNTPFPATGAEYAEIVKVNGVIVAEGTEEGSGETQNPVLDTSAGDTYIGDTSVGDASTGD